MHPTTARTLRSLLVTTLWGSAPLAAVPTTLTAQTPAEEVRSLSEHPAVRRAFDFIEEADPRTIRELIELTQIAAPPFMEEERARVYADWLREAGADSVFIDEEGNAVAIRYGRGGARGQTPDGGRRTVGFSGHLDTVFPPDVDVTVTQRGDTLFAPGIGDDTRGLMAVLTVLRALEASGIETEADVRFIGTVGEEGLGDLRGMKYLFREGADPIHTWIDIDGTGLGRIVNKGLGSHRFRVTFRGPGGHSWGAFGLANPAHALGRGIRHFQDVADTLTRSGPRTSYNVGRMGGGTSVNAIPFEAWMEVDMRSESEESLGRIDAAFRNAMQRALEEENALRRDGPGIELELDQIGDRPSGEVADDHPLVERAIAVMPLFGAVPALTRSSTDSNIPISLGIPAVTIGSGGIGSGAHSPGEWWINRDGHRGIQANLLLLVSEAGLAEPIP
ncbi:M20/M25/M40 family metallo-hydrolase [Candidatus Palauibacter sp.]|uniref:M20/M25/M40 family metallo-hydrolase n=1 Tax=Candidatus Palauibacter sp. TaxID=3101350 RepID=UPI003B028BCD